MSKYSISVFIFRRDYRLYDNIGLIKALSESTIVIPIYIFTDEQVVNNKYKSNNSIQFMLESLTELNKDLLSFKSRLFYFFGKPYEIIEELINNVKIKAVYFNMDYTPYATLRDDLIKKVCLKKNIDCNISSDILLNDVNLVKNGSDESYVKFTPYFNKAKTYKVALPITNKYKNYYNGNNQIINEYKKNIFTFCPKLNVDLNVHGGRIRGLRILKNIGDFKMYNSKRNDLMYDSTMLSAYNKFGCLSIREVYYKIFNILGIESQLISQLYWRDFYYTIMYSYPQVMTRSLKPSYDNIKWLGTTKSLNKWKNAKTGFPIVDACMRQINKIGFMHNRGRLITSSFLVKVLQVNWREGEKYFATHLVDYDPSQNNGGWAWVAGGGSDSQPYFRIFNPWRQAEKYDPECEYIKKWIPELADVSIKHIHEWNKYYSEHTDISYNKPMVDYTIQSKLTLEMYKKMYS